MGDWPNGLLVPPRIITPFSLEALGTGSLLSAVALASTTVTQNQAYYYPFHLDVGATAVKMVAMIGATSNGNIDVGIYDASFNYIISSGAVAMSVTTSAAQEVDITDTYLPPGNYWMAISCSSATGTFFTKSAADEIEFGGMVLYAQATSHPLPTSSATPVKNTESTPLLIGMAVSFHTLI